MKCSNSLYSAIAVSHIGLYCLLILSVNPVAAIEICAGAAGDLNNQTFADTGETTTCSASPDILFGPNVNIDPDASVALFAPEIDLVAPVSIAAGARFSANTAVAKIALARSIGGQNHVGLLNIDTNEWFDVSSYLDSEYGAMGGGDRWLSVSSDLQYYLLETERPAVYNGWSGLTWGTLDANGIPSEPVVVDGHPHPEGVSVISPGGRHIAMILRDDGPNFRNDIRVVARIGGVWQRGTEVTISGSSAGNNNGSPHFSLDGAKVIWNSSQDGATGFDENSLDGTQFRHLLDHTRLGASSQAIITPSYEPNGSIIFEGEIFGEECYRWDPDNPTVDPVVIDPTYSNDNSCFALPDGRIASFWLQRPGNVLGGHEPRIMLSDGTHQVVLQQDIDFWDFLITGGIRYAE